MSIVGGFLCRPTISSLKKKLIGCKTVSNFYNSDSVRCFSVTSRRNMKILQFTNKCKCPCDIRVGYLVGENEVVDINNVDTSLPTTLLKILETDALDRVKK